MNAITKSDIDLMRRAINTAQESNEYEDTESAFRIIKIVIDKAELLLDIENSTLTCTRCNYQGREIICPVCSKNDVEFFINSLKGSN
jgi:rubrerythrin